MSALIRHVALVSETPTVSPKDLMKVAAAMQKQAVRDLGPIWEVSATVDAFASLDDVPPGYWPIILMDDIGFDGAAGIHLDKDGQPYALVTATTDLDGWSMTASHELLEMLADPFGNRLVAGDSPKEDQGRVRFLVEVSDPSEAAEFGYSTNGILMSDFYTPQFFDPVAANGVRYSFTGAIKRPRQVLRGGYLSWEVAETGHWWQETWFGGSSSTFRDIGPINSSGGSIRSQIDRLTARETSKAVASGRKAATVAGLSSRRVGEASSALASAWREQISSLTKNSPKSKQGKSSSDGRRRTTGFLQPE